MINELTALVIDDEPFVRELLVDVLESEGYSTHSAETTRHGRDLVNQNSYRLVITDLNQTPTGVDIYKLARERGMSACIVTGGSDVPGLMEEALRVAGQNLIEKPFDIKQIQEIAKQVKGQHQS